VLRCSAALSLSSLHGGWRANGILENYRCKKKRFLRFYSRHVLTFLTFCLFLLRFYFCLNVEKMVYIGLSYYKKQIKMTFSFISFVIQLGR